MSAGNRGGGVGKGSMWDTQTPAYSKNTQDLLKGNNIKMLLIENNDRIRSQSGALPQFSTVVMVTHVNDEWNSMSRLLNFDLIKM